MKLFRNILPTVVFFLIVNQMNAQQTSSISEEIMGDNEVTALKKANTKVEKAENSATPSNNPTWERTKNPNPKETAIVPKEEPFITNEKARKPE
ncbi:MAG: hypothetical protein J0L87_05330 [Bacteroidetes bacterium]|nr:hypothetical protein [Bacteroidota bacterium]